MPAEYLAGLNAALPARAERIRERILDAPEHRQSYVATADEAGTRVVGFVHVGRYRLDQTPGGPLDPYAGEVYAIYVDPDVWGSGAGQALMEVGLDWLARRRLRPVRLWVLEGNARARAFYERRGFAPDGEVATIAIEQPGQVPIELPELRYALVG
jgi:GNAT superfamily N-acetyltransferase